MTEVATQIGKPTPEAEYVFRRWLQHLNEEFTRHTGYERRSEIVRDELHMLVLGRPHGGRSTTTLITDMPLNVLTDSFDARNVVLAAEMLETFDHDLYYPIKPLILFWQAFDRSTLGVNLWLGCRFRGMLSQHIFHSVGKGVRINPGVSFTHGYNIAIPDNTFIPSNTNLDDRTDLHTQT